MRWFNERRYQEAVREMRGSEVVVDRDHFWETETVTVHPLDGPGLANTTHEEILERIRGAELACARRRGGRPVLGAATVVRQDPRARPKHPNRSPRPLCHASTDGGCKSYRTFFREFCKRF